MRKISLLSALLLFVTITFAQTNFTATYNLAGSDNNVTSFTYNGDTYEGITPQPLLKVGVSTSPSNNNYRATDWPLGATSGSDVFTGTIDLEKYIGFSIEPVTGYTFTITSIKFGLGRSATGPRQFEWRGNADGFASTLSTYEALNTNLTNVDGVLTCLDENSNWLNNTLTPGAAYQNLSTTTEFRLYAYNSEKVGGTAGLQGNLIIEGTFVATGTTVLTINSPANNAIVNEDQVEVSFSTTNFELGTDGKLEYKLNGGAPAYTTTSPFTITGLAEGENTIVFQLVNMDNTALDPAVTVTRTVTYEVPNTDPSLTITLPADNTTVNVNEVQVTFTTTNFELGVAGKLEYKLNGGTANYVTTTDPFTISDLAEGENTIVFQLVNMDNTALDPVVSVTRTVTYEIVVLEPSLTISSPQDGAIIYSNDININFTVQDFVLGIDGKLAYKLDEGAIQYYTGTSPLTLTGVAYGTHQIYFELVTMADASLDPAVTTTVNFTNQEPLPGGMETFDNANIGTSYADGSFIGNNNIQWTYTHSRDEGDYAINGKGLMLRRPSDSSIESQTLSGGIASFEVKFRKAFEGASERGLELYINGELKGTSDLIPGVSGANATIYTFSVDNINVPGDFVIKIKIAGTTEYNRQITIDDISWTGYNSTEPYLAITSPSNGQIFYENTVSVNYTTTNFTVGTDGKAKYIIDGAAPVYTTNNPITLTNLADGEHTFSLELVNMDNESYSPAVIRTITFTTNTEGPEFTDIYDIQYTLDESGDSPLKNQYVWVKGIVVANFNPSTYGEGYYIQQGGGAWNGIYVADLVNSPTVGDSVKIAGKVVESYGLTSIKELTYFEAFATDGILAAPAEVSTADAGTEAYESCLVKVIDAECTQGIISYGEWYVDDGSGELLVKENGVSSIQPVVGNHYDIVGVIYYGYSKFSLQYRSDADIVITNINEDFANSLSLYPNPANSFVNISSEFEINNIKVTNNLGQVVLEQNAKSNNVNLNVENLESGIYFININSNDKNTVLRFIKE